MKRSCIIAAYPGGVEHIGRESTWQGKYDDEYTVEENLKFRNSSMEEILTFYKPRHTYQDGKYWYEKNPPKMIIESTPGNDEKFIKSLFMNHFNFELDPLQIQVVSSMIDSNDDSEEEKTEFNDGIIAFNYVWPNYGYKFLKQSIESILPYVNKYILYFNKYSYLGVPCPQQNIQEVNDLINSIGSDKIIVKFNESKHFPDEAKNDNIGYYIRKCLDEYNGQSEFLWLVQSDEIYTSEMCQNVIDLCNTDSVLHCAIFTPICYMDTPQWKVDPPETVQRVSLIRNNHWVDLNHKTRFTSISFNHMSYVLDFNELDVKFSNWGHRNDVDIKSFRTKFNNLKHDKSLINLHPIVGSIYPSVKFDDSDFAKSLFRYWIDHGNVLDTVSFIADHVCATTANVVYYTSDSFGIYDIDYSKLYTSNTDIYLTDPNKIFHGSIFNALQHIPQESVELFIYKMDNVDQFEDIMSNLYIKIKHCGLACIITPKDMFDIESYNTSESKLVYDSDNQRFVVRFYEFEKFEYQDYDLYVFRVNLNNDKLENIKADKVVFGPFVGEFGWEISKWAPMVNKFILDNDCHVVVSTSQSNFGLYFGANDYHVVTVPDLSRNCFENSSITGEIKNKLLNSIKTTFPEHEIIDPADFENALNVFSWKDMDFFFHCSPELIDSFKELVGDRFPIAISARHIVDKPRNWSIDNWKQFYQLINQSNDLFGFVVGKSPTVVKTDVMDNIVYVEDLFNDVELINKTIASLHVVELTVGQQSALPILSQYVGTPTLMFGHRKYRNMCFDNPRKVIKDFIDDPDYTISPDKLFNQLKLFIKRIKDSK